MTDRYSLDQLADELLPTRPVHPKSTTAVLLILTLAGGAFVVGTLGFRHGLAGASATDPMFLLRTILLATLAIVSLVAVTKMAQPAVDRPPSIWRWTLGAALLIPLSAALAALVSTTPIAGRLYPENGIECLTYSIGIGLILATILTLWLRRGAPVQLERAAFLTGIASGSLGALAYSMHCPHNDIVYIGLWYTLAIAITTIACRMVIPPLIRW